MVAVSPEKKKKPMSRNVAKGKAKSAARAMDKLKASRETGKPGKGKVNYNYKVEKPKAKPAEAKAAPKAEGKVNYNYQVKPGAKEPKGPLRAPKGGPAGMDSGGGSKTASAFREGMARANAPGSMSARAARGLTGNKVAAAGLGIGAVIGLLAPSLYADVTEAEREYQSHKSQRESQGQEPEGRFKHAFNQENPQATPQRRATDPGIDPTARPPAPQRSEIESSLPSAQTVRDQVTKPNSPATSSPAGGVQTRGGLYPIYNKGSSEAKDFRSKFAEERKSGAKDFEWQGRKYNTKTKEDK